MKININMVKSNFAYEKYQKNLQLFGLFLKFKGLLQAYGKWYEKMIVPG